MTAAIAIPLIATVGGAVMQQMAMGDASSARNAQLARMMSMNREGARKNIDLVMEGAQQYEPVERTQRLEDTAGEATQSLAGYLTAARDSSAGPRASGNVSDAYLIERGKRDAGNLELAHKLASLMGRTRAPTDMMREESFANADLASQRSTNASNLRSRMGVEELAYQNIQPSSLMMTLGSLMPLAGQAYAGGMFSPMTTPGPWQATKNIVPTSSWLR